MKISDYLLIFIRVLLWVMGFSLPLVSSAQNLIINPGFEQITDCPNFFSKIDLAPPWNMPTGGTTDLFNTCSTHYSSTVPLNFAGYQYPRTGAGHSGIIVWEVDRTYREYLQGELKQAMQAGKTYYVSFYVSLGSEASGAVDKIGAHFSTQSIYTHYQDFDTLPFIPQIIRPTGEYLADTLNWMEINGYYKAKGGEKYIILGNFVSNKNLARYTFPNVYGGAQIYYYIDDVAVYTCDDLVDLGKDTILCYGDTLELDALVQNDKATYLWQDGSTNSTFSVSKSGTYWVEIKSEHCYGRDTIQIEYENKKEFSIGADQIICKGDKAFLTASSADGPYLWSNGTTQPTLSVSKAGTYWVHAYKEGCKVRDTIVIQVEEPIFLQLGKDTAVCSTDPFFLSVSIPGTSYLWSDGSTLPTLEVKRTGSYWLEVRGQGCVALDTIQVQVYDCLGEIPNVITPNGDEKNDAFTIQDIEHDKWHLFIYNKWGELVYENPEYRNSWNAEGSASGIYYYRIENRTTGKNYKGWIHVLQ